MQEKLVKFFLGLLCIVFFALCVAAIVIGQKNIGPAGLGVMLAGLAGLLVLLYLYNRRYTK